MQVKTGKGPISLMVVMAIWSLSLAVDLPGLAVTPIENAINSIFPHATEFEVQLLTVLPNLIIIPFVLLSGFLSRTRHKITIIFLGIALYLLAAVLYLFSNSMGALIWLSCLLGAGCGLILPFSTGLIADVFTGKYRMKQMGIISAIGNIALVAATFIVGFLFSKEHWHLPFLVYLIPVVSLLLLPWLKKIPQADMDLDGDGNAITSDTAKQAAAPAQPLVVPAQDEDGFSTQGQKVVGGFYIGRTIWLLLAYFFFVFATSVPAYYLPDLMPEYHMSTEMVSIVTSLFYFAMFAIGIVVNPVLKAFRSTSFILAGALCLGGFILFAFTQSLVLFLVAAAIMGLGNGLAQPIFYDKATEICVTTSRATLAMAYLQTANYIAISMVPVIIGLFRIICNQHTSNLFPFVITMIFMAIVLFFIIIRVKHFTFGIHKQYYE